MVSVIIQDQISSFFREPSASNPAGTTRSVLFILRRDLCSLYGPEDGPRAKDPNGPPMLMVLGMCSGVDMLSWIVMGDAEQKVPGKADYERFLVDFCGLSADEAKVIYQFRCAQMHSYGLYTVSRVKPKPIPFGFTLTTATEVRSLIQPLPGQGNHFVVGFWEFKVLFLRAIAEVHRRLLAHTAPGHGKLLNSFYQTTTKMGFVSVQ